MPNTADLTHSRIYSRQVRSLGPLTHFLVLSHSLLTPLKPPLDSQYKENHISHEEAVNAHVSVYPRREKIRKTPQNKAKAELPVIKKNSNYC